MGSRSPSEDEGEIIETISNKMTKATTAQPYSREPRVNRRTSYSSDSSVSSHSSDRRYSRRRSHSRSRSRSPFRHTASRDEKSSHADPSDRSRRDPRHFNVHYENKRHGKERASYDRTSRGDHNDSRSRNGHRDEGHRKRTHSPDWRDRKRDVKRGRHESTADASRRDDGAHRGKHEGQARHEGHKDRVGRLQDGFVSQQDRSTSKTVSSVAKELRVSDSLPARQMSEPRSGPDRPRANGGQNGDLASISKSPANDGSVLAQPKSALKKTAQVFPDEEEKPIDELTEIERRRKRREAILAKHKTQSSSLLVQALEQGSEAAVTPKSPSVAQTRSVSPSSNPGTPRDTSAPGSPASFTITRDEDLANRPQTNPTTPDADESSADYDPMMDMQEDRARHDPILKSTELSASNYDETKSEVHDILMPDSPVKPTEKSPQAADEFDMFAENADVDMFAPEAAQLSKPQSKIVSLSTEQDTNLVDNWDDVEGYYRITLHEVLDGRYRVIAHLGKGMFSGVVRAEDVQTKRLVAIKVIRNNETMRKAGMKEIGILQALAEADPESKKNVIRLQRYFDHRGHLCMVFENLSINLREVLKKFGRDVGINLTAIRSYAHQMFVGLSLLKKCNYLHADLKPDNILVDEGRKHLKICDLGSAGDATENDATPYLVSRFYRAPEIILGMRFDFAIDMWSIGCTLYELYTGKILFTGRSNNQMLRLMMECRGKFSIKMLKKAEFAGLHFEDSGVFRSVERDKITGKDVVRMLNFSSPTRDLKARLLASAKGLTPEELRELNLFTDLLDKCLHLNPERRLTPTEALKHPFISRAKVGGHAH